MEGNNNQNQQGDGNVQQNQSQQQNNNQNQQTVQIDYDKLASVIAGKQQVTEDTVLKNYLKNQGLSGDELNQAIATFKEQKAKNTPDPVALQQQVASAQQQAQQAIIERDAYMLSGDLGVDAKTMPYLLKMADFKDVVGEDGNVAQDKLKEALNKVLTDIPQLKQQNQNASGFRFGVSGNQQQAGNATDEALDRIFGVKKN